MWVESLCDDFSCSVQAGPLSLFFSNLGLLLTIVYPAKQGERQELSQAEAVG